MEMYRRREMKFTFREYSELILAAVAESGAFDLETRVEEEASLVAFFPRSLAE